MVGMLNNLWRRVKCVEGSAETNLERERRVYFNLNLKTFQTSRKTYLGAVGNMEWKLR